MKTAPVVERRSPLPFFATVTSASICHLLSVMKLWRGGSLRCAVCELLFVEHSLYFQWGSGYDRGML
jgi:hypothetical protein